MKNIESNKVFDKCFVNERAKCSEPIKQKELEKDVKKIFWLEKITGYRCYFGLDNATIYYIVETKDKYITYKEHLPTKDSVAYEMKKEEL